MLDFVRFNSGAEADFNTDSKEHDLRLTINHLFLYLIYIFFFGHVF
jgi:hypothetical protein